MLPPWTPVVPKTVIRRFEEDMSLVRLVRVGYVRLIFIYWIKLLEYGEPSEGEE